MAKQANIRATGLVVKALPNAHFIVKVVDQGFDGHEIEAHISGKMRLNFIKILPGDYVVIEMSPFDLKKGRIVYRGREMKPAATSVEEAAATATTTTAETKI